MKFKRIDVDTVRCIISEDELNENGLDVDDFLQNDGKTESFLRKIITMAEEEVGYKVQGGNISIQVAVLPEHTLALTFSEKQDMGMANMLANLKSAVESLAKNVPKADGADDGNLLDADEVKRIKNDSDVSEKNKENKDSSKNGGFAIKGKMSYQIRFADIERVIAYAKGVLWEQGVNSSLYYLPREGAYYLLFERAELDDKRLCRLLSASLEFAEEIYAHRPTKAFIIEHGRCILGDSAIEHLQEI